MPIGPTVSDSYGPAIAAENAAIESEIERLAQQRQTMAASNDRSTPVPQRFRDAARAAQQRLDQAEAQFTIADGQARLRIRMEKPSEQLARVWYEEGTLRAERERTSAKEALAAAELQLGEQVQNRRRLQQLEASAPGRRAEAERVYVQMLDNIDAELQQARLRCAT